MNKRKVALILIVVVLSLCMMAMLTQISARSDFNLCSRSAEMVQRVYELNAKSERKLAELDALLAPAAKDASGMEDYLKKVSEILPEGMTLEENRITWTDPLDNRNLECVVELTPPGEKQRTKWISHKLMVNEPEDDWEW